MAKNYVAEGDVIDYVNGGTPIAAGAVVLIGKRIGIAIADIAANATGAVAVEGIWNVAKLGTDVVGQGDLLYWDAGNSRLTTTATSNTQAGFAAAVAGNGVTTVNIKINQ